MKKILFISLIMVLTTEIVFPQNKSQKIQVDFNEIKGELTSKDLFKKDFGRYDGYEIELFEGESVNFVAYSNGFQPSIALVNAKGDIFKQSVRNNKGYANIVSVILSRGKYVLYVVGDENATGSYTLQTAVAEPNSLALDNSTDFCTTLDFLLAHAAAYFFLLENPELAKGSLIKLNESIDVYIDEDAGSYNATYYNNNDLLNAAKIYRNLHDKIGECLGKEWYVNTTNWQNIDGYKEKSIIYSEKEKSRSRYIKIVMNDYTLAKERYEYNYSVRVEINKNH